MKSFLIILVFSLLTNLVHSSTLLEKTYQTEFEILNQEIRHELLNGDLTSRSVKQSLKARIKTLGSIALQIGGRRNRRMVVSGYKKTLAALTSMDETYRAALEMTYANGLTGREIIIEAMDTENNKKIVDIYNQKKDYLRASYHGKELKDRAMDMTLEEVDGNQDFAFLKVEPVANYVLTGKTFNFLKEKCVSKYGEEDFHLLIFGINVCYSDKYKIDRWTVGPGYYYEASGYSYMTGLKIGKKGFKGIGVRVQIGASYAGGIGVFIGNGLILSLDLEKAYGIFAGVTYINLNLK